MLNRMVKKARRSIFARRYLDGTTGVGSAWRRKGTRRRHLLCVGYEHALVVSAPIEEPGTFLKSVGLGTMGFAFLAGMGTTAGPS